MFTFYIENHEPFGPMTKNCPKLNNNKDIEFRFYIFVVYIPGEGALECNLTGKCPFFKNLHNTFMKKLAFRYPVSECLDYKTIGKQ